MFSARKLSFDTYIFGISIKFSLLSIFYDGESERTSFSTLICWPGTEMRSEKTFVEISYKKCIFWSILMCWLRTRNWNFMKTLSFETIPQIRIISVLQFFWYLASPSTKFIFLLVWHSVLCVFLRALSESQRISAIKLIINVQTVDYLPQLSCSVEGHDLCAIESILRNHETKRIFYGE